MKFEDFGTLTVITTSANSSLPVEGTLVRIIEQTFDYSKMSLGGFRCILNIL